MGERRAAVAARQPLEKGGEARVAQRVCAAVVTEREADIGEAAVRAVEDAQLRLFIGRDVAGHLNPGARKIGAARKVEMLDHPLGETFALHRRDRKSTL